MDMNNIRMIGTRKSKGVFGAASTVAVQSQAIHLEYSSKN